MLSVLIPIYNFDVRAFVASLSKQSSQLSVPCEILCLDDASDASFREMHAGLNELPHVHYIESVENLGRSAVRNRLEEEARYENLLFLDCDGRVVRDDYLKAYIELGEYDVVYGGRVYPTVEPTDPELRFHWLVGKAKEEVGVEQRLKAPYKSFMTNNFLVRREVFRKVKMDESVKGYGHEDTLFAMDLKRQGFTVQHIDNPLEHIGIEKFDVFIEKSANGVRNLAKLMQAGKVDDSIKLVRYYQKMNGLGLIWLITRWVKRNRVKIMKNLKGANPRLMWFDLWKVTMLSEAQRKKD